MLRESSGSKNEVEDDSVSTCTEVADKENVHMLSNGSYKCPSGASYRTCVIRHLRPERS